MSNRIAIAVHGGAGALTPYLKAHSKHSEEGLHESISIGYHILEKGGSALDAIEASVRYLEDNPFFNAGRGSALTAAGKVEMDASIMDGDTLQAGAVSLVTNVRNPVSLARTVMSKTQHVFIAGEGAQTIAKNMLLPFEADDYFITEHQYEAYLDYKNKTTKQDKKTHGTVGAVAVDRYGNIAAATSTGGTSNCLPGRIGDSCIIGAGCYANNSTCAVSGTGEGEYLIRGVVGNSISMLIELEKSQLQAACDRIIFTTIKNLNGEMGVIAVNKAAEIAISFNTETMRRGWWREGENPEIKIYK